jgi:hypothetical protein
MELIFTTKADAASESRSISRKDAKAAKVGKNSMEILRKNYYPSELGDFAP